MAKETEGHTAGPWDVHTTDTGLEIHPLSDEDGMILIADLPSGECPNREADAALIARAPDYHAALERINALANREGEQPGFSLKAQRIAQEAIRGVETPDLARENEALRGALERMVGALEDGPLHPLEGEGAAVLQEARSALGGAR